MSPGATPPHIPALFAGGEGISQPLPNSGGLLGPPIQIQRMPYFQAAPGSHLPTLPTPPEAACWLCPPSGSGLRPSMISLGTCQYLTANTAQIPDGWTLSTSGDCPPSGPASPPPPPPPQTGDGGALPPVYPPGSPPNIQPRPGGGVAPTGQTYGQLPPAVPSTSANVTINGQPMICCPCTTNG